VRITQSARKHGIADEDIIHAFFQSPAHFVPLDEDSFLVPLDEDRFLVLGPDRAANILELILLIADDGTPVVIHAMKATKQNLRFL
jgi:hypothetical protein